MIYKIRPSVIKSNKKYLPHIHQIVRRQNLIEFEQNSRIMAITSLTGIRIFLSFFSGGEKDYNDDTFYSHSMEHLTAN